MRSRPVSVTSPITVASTSHFSQIARNLSTSPGSATAIIRSCDSLIRISSGASVLSRSGEQLEGALDQQLLHERVADLHAGSLRGAGLVERLAREHAHPADAVTTG